MSRCQRIAALDIYKYVNRYLLPLSWYVSLLVPWRAQRSRSNGVLLCPKAPIFVLSQSTGAELAKTTVRPCRRMSHFSTRLESGPTRCELPLKKLEYCTEDRVHLSPSRPSVPAGLCRAWFARAMESICADRLNIRQLRVSTREHPEC